MLNRNEMRQAKKVIDALVSNPEAIRFTLDGVLADVDSGKWSDTDVLIPMIGAAGTIGAVRARPDWKTDPVIINHLIASIQGRMMQFSLIEHAHINPISASPEQLASLMMRTDNQQRQILQDVVGKEKAEAHWKEEQAEMEALAQAYQATQGSVKF